MNLDLLDIRKTALVVVDMQNAFCHKEGTLGISGVDTDHLSSIVAPLRDLVKRCRAVDMPVLWTLQEHFPVDHRRARKRLPSHTSRRKRVSALVGTWDAEIIDEFKEFADDPTFVIRKHRYGAFHETRMHIVLEMLGVDALLIAGLTTNACVETTIREAYLRDYDVVGVTDCISGVNPTVGIRRIGGLASVFRRDLLGGRRICVDRPAARAQDAGVASRAAEGARLRTIEALLFRSSRLFRAAECEAAGGRPPVRIDAGGPGNYGAWLW